MAERVYVLPFLRQSAVVRTRASPTSILFCAYPATAIRLGFTELQARSTYRSRNEKLREHESRRTYSMDRKCTCQSSTPPPMHTHATESVSRSLQLNVAYVAAFVHSNANGLIGASRPTAVAGHESKERPQSSGHAGCYFWRASLRRVCVYVLLDAAGLPFGFVVDPGVVDPPRL